MIESRRPTTLSDDINALKKQNASLNAALSCLQKSYDTNLHNKQLVIDVQTQKLDEQSKRIDNQQAQINQLQETIRLLLAKRYGRSSEQYTDLNDRQGWLFDESVDPAFTQVEDVVEGCDNEAIEVKPYQRKKRGKRLPLPDYLPRERVIYDLPEQELITADGERYRLIGEEVCEQLDVIPATVRVLQHVRLKYAVPGKDELGIKMASMPPQAIAKSQASSGLLAHIVQAKYCHHLPLYRQESIWRGLDISIPRNSMCRWLVQLGQKVQPIVDEIFEQMKPLPYIQADETGVTVVNERTQPQKISHNGYMWLYNNTAGVVYEYKPTRAGQNAKDKLEEYKGYVQSDAYNGYNLLFGEDSQRISVGCWAHARRKFVEVIQALDKDAKKKPGVADEMLKTIGKLYAIETDIKAQGFTHKQAAKIRQDEAIPVLDEIKKMLDDVVLKTPPQSKLGKAIAYSLNNWPQLTRYTEHGAIPIDNNDTERKIKPFAVGRKNWLFAGNTEGAKAGANLISLIENAKLYNLKVFDYLRYVFDRIGSARSDRDYEQLTPKFAQQHVAKLKPDKQSKPKETKTEAPVFSKNG
ncbi:IS66 family transposase [Facilibium subflavum]|uniref:IS66 family transposase n=1 Tax=Facilibium subflavum TaxID=2219058 RepID=UPI0013C306B9|nr:IS66 family transposase [Facilibium subflavum]